MPYIQRKSEKATFFSKKNPFFLFCFIPQLHRAKKCDKRTDNIQILYRNIKKEIRYRKGFITEAKKEKGCIR